MSNLILFQERESAFERRLLTFAVVNVEHIDIREFLADAYRYFEENVIKLLAEHTLVKVNTVLKLVFSKYGVNEENGAETVINRDVFIATNMYVIDFETDLKEHYDEFIVAYLMARFDSFAMEGSGFSLSKINELSVQIVEFHPLKGSSHIDLPPHIKLKHAVINVKNNDDQCFKYAVLSALHPANLNPHRSSHYTPYANDLKFDGIHFPVQLKDISKFEKLNENISINVYVCNNKKETVTTLRLTKNVKQNHIHLLLLTSPNGEESHFCWIKYMSRLLSSQISKNSNKKYFCDRCLNHFANHDRLTTHSTQCMQQNEHAIEMPTEENRIIRFKNFQNQLKVPFIVYADIETLLKSPDASFCKSEAANTTAYQQHEAFSIGYFFKCMHDNTKSYYRSARGMDCIEWFVKQMYDIANTVTTILSEVVQMETTEENEIAFIIAGECHICGEKYIENEIPVRDHCHLTGKYRGSAHSRCNLNYQLSRNIPIVFHNLSNYDSHFLMRKLATVFDGNISIIPINDQNYISFTKTVVDRRIVDYRQHIRLRFIDSFRFMASSLDQLAKLIPPEKKVILRCECEKREMNAEQIALLGRKGVFCYDYVSSYDKLNETNLPEKKYFYSKLMECEISDENYTFANEVWNKFNIKTLGEYSDLYLMADVLLLADIFENFRENCYSVYNLDPAHYFTAPGLSFDAMLKYTKVEIELLTDVDMLMFVENGIRGGISQCSKRYVEANNMIPYLN